MFRKLALLLAVVLFALLGALYPPSPPHANAQPTGTLTQIPRSPGGATPDDPNAYRAMGLRAFVGCSAPGRGDVLLIWQPPRFTGQAQAWLDISANPNDFAPGTFIGTLLSGTTQSGLEWGGLLTGVTYYARVNFLQGASLPTPVPGYPFWATSDTVVFTTPAC